MPFGPNAITTGYGHSQYVANGLSAQVLQYVPAQSPANTIITGGSIDNTPIGQSIPAAGSFTTLTATTPLGVASGGSGISTLPGNGKLLIGNGTGYTLANLTAGSGISITNASGSITIAQTNSPGTVTSVAASGGSTGLTFSGSPITTSGTLTLGGTLAIGSGGTNSTTASGARTNLGLDTMATQASTNVSITGGAIDGTVIGNTTPTTAKFTTVTATGVAATRTDGNYQYTLASATKTYGFATSGSTFLLDDVTSSVNRFALTGSGVPSFSALSTNGFVKATGGVGTLTTSASVSLTADVSNTLPLANGGTGQTTANAAFNALAPSQTGNSGKYLTTDGSNTSWAVNPLGTVTSVSVTTANGVSGTVANSTTTPAISLTLGDITPSSVTALNNTGGYQIIAGQLTSGDRVGISGQASGTGAALVFFDNAQTTFRPSIFDASQHTFKISGTATTSITSTGIQSAIGATTPAAGTFTDVYATTLSDGFTNVAAAGTTTTLTSSSIRNYVVTGSGGQTYKLPDATTLRSGSIFQFNNNQSSGTIVVQNNSSTTITTIQSGGYVEVILLSNSTAAGTWDSHAQAPSNVTWSTNTFDYAGSITSATWNGTAVAINRGGTGQATAQLAINALAGAVTSGSYLRGNGTNVVMNTIQAADVPTLNQNTTGSAATLTTPRAIYGNNFDGSAALTQVIASTYGGTGNGFTKFSGPTTAEKTFTLPNASSTLLYDGGALGTPASGTVTNLTGTASININGTVGATTPSTLAATTGTFTATGQVQYFSGATTASKYIRLENTGGNSYFGIEGATPAFGGTAYAAFLFAPNEIDMLVGSVKVGAFTSTGLNSTPIGVTTASTGAFTSLTSTSGAINGTVGATTASTGAFTAATIKNAGSAATLRIGDAGLGGGSINSIIFDYELNAASRSWRLMNDVNAFGDFVIQQSTTRAGSTYADIASLSSTGLAVTGAVSGSAPSAGATTFTATSNGVTGINHPLYTFQRFGGAVAGEITYEGVGATMNLWTTTAHNLVLGYNRTAIATVSSTGLAVTGALSATDTISTIKAVASAGNIVSIKNSTDTGGDNTRYAGVNFLVGSDDGTSSIRSYRTNSASNYETALAFLTNPSGATQTPTEKMRITSTGNVGIGTSSPAYKLSSSAGAADGTTGNAGAFYANQGTSGDAWILIGGKRSDSLGSGRLSFINAKNANGGGILTFQTEDTERARIDSSGNLLVGTTSQLDNGRFCVLANGTNGIVSQQNASGGWCYEAFPVSNGGSYYMMSFNAAGSNVGSIVYNGTVTVYSTTSDYRLKDITGPLTDSGSFIDALKPKVGTWKESGNKFVGFIAHEFAEVSPSSVAGEKDAVDADGKPVYQAMQASSAEVIANLVAELQSVRQRLAALESK